VKILEQETKREDFTQHGLHLNMSGKDKIAKLLAQNITQLFEDMKKIPIAAKWKTTNNVCDLINGSNYAKNVDNDPIDNKERHEDFWTPLIKEAEHQAGQRGSQTLEVMIFYGHDT